MENRFVFIVLFIAIGMCSCSTQDTSSDGDLDSSKIIEFGIDHLYKTHDFAAEYYTLPVKIIGSSNVPKNIKFLINGKYCEVLHRPDKTLYYNDLGKPIPFVDIRKLQILKNGTIELEIYMPSIGGIFLLKMNKNYTRTLNVMKVLESKTKPE